MLVKASRAEARNAAFVQGSAGIQSVGPESVKSDWENVQLGNLKREIDDLKSALEHAEARLVSEVDRARLAGRAEALREFRSNDDRNHLMLQQTLSEAAARVGKTCESVLGESAGKLAALALSRLVEPLELETEWLRRVVLKAAEGVRREMLVSVRLPASIVEGEGLEALRERLPPGTLVEVDTSLARNAARLVLQLGSVELNAAAGRQRLAELLVAGLNDAS